jgi:hypothetical protein
MHLLAELLVLLAVSADLMMTAGQLMGIPLMGPVLHDDLANMLKTVVEKI